VAAAAVRLQGLIDRPPTPDDPCPVGLRGIVPSLNTPYVSIRFFKQLRRAEGLFVTDRCRPPVAALDPIQQRQADALVARALGLQARVAAGARPEANPC